MNLRDLKYIIAVADTQHFGRAADRCFVSQPTLRGQIKKMEEELGVAIFERSNRSVEVTPAGKAILALARQMLEHADAITQIARASGPVGGTFAHRRYPDIESVFAAVDFAASEEAISPDEAGVVGRADRGAA